MNGFLADSAFPPAGRPLFLHLAGAVQLAELEAHRAVLGGPAAALYGTGECT